MCREPEGVTSTCIPPLRPPCCRGGGGDRERSRRPRFCRLPPPLPPLRPPRSCCACCASRSSSLQDRLRSRRLRFCSLACVVAGAGRLFQVHSSTQAHRTPAPKLARSKETEERSPRASASAAAPSASCKAPPMPGPACTACSTARRRTSLCLPPPPPPPLRRLSFLPLLSRRPPSSPYSSPPGSGGGVRRKSTWREQGPGSEHGSALSKVSALWMRRMVQPAHLSPPPKLTATCAASLHTRLPRQPSSSAPKSPAPRSPDNADASFSLGWELPVPLPAPTALGTGGRCRPQRPCGSSSLPPYQMQMRGKAKRP